MANLLCTVFAACRRLLSLFPRPLRCAQPRQAYSQGLFHKLCLLTNMSLEAPGRYEAAERRPQPRPRVEAISRRFDPLLDIGPGAHVAGFFLAPDHLQCVYSFMPLHDQGRDKLLKADQVDIANLALLLLFQEIEIDLAAAETT